MTCIPFHSPTIPPDLSSATGNPARGEDGLKSSTLSKRANDSQASMDSSPGSEAILANPALTASHNAAALHGHSDTDLLNFSKRQAAGPGSVQSDMTDDGGTSLRVPGRPAPGWKGRMSSMLLRKPTAGPEADTIKAQKVWLLVLVVLPVLSDVLVVISS